MPELPEVQTTVNGLNETVKNKSISDVWSDYFLRTASRRKDNIKNKKYFEEFKKEITGRKIKNVERRGKNVLIHLSGGKTILVHMKMTGHFLYDNRDKFVHLDFTLSNGKHLAFSDMRKFAKIILLETDKMHRSDDLKTLGPEANDPKLDWRALEARLFLRPNGKIKTVLMDQSVISGIGNIYSDEILWASHVHPERLVKNLSGKDIRNVLRHTLRILSRSISVGGDSVSDYRNISGRRGGYQNLHRAYRRAGEKCPLPGCGGVIVRKIVGGRSAHFCNTHQKRV